jgi:drug/metabolite transporter (DMT)-like permease
VAPLQQAHNARMTSHARHTTLDARAIVLVVGCCLVWGMGQIAIKAALLGGLPPLLQAGVRSLIACALVLGWAAWRGVPMFERDGSLPAGLLLGGLFAVEFACVFLGQMYAPASRIAVFVYLAPFFVALAMPLVARAERLTLPQWLGLVLAFSGVAWAFVAGQTSPYAGPLQWLGDLLGIVGAVLWAATLLAIRGTRLATVTAEKTLAYQLAVSGVGLTVIGLLTGERWPAEPSTLALAALAFQILAVAFASLLVWFWLVAHYPATRLMSFTLLTPLASLVFGVLLLDEPLTLELVVAATGVTLGLWLVNRR